ncbi:MAG: molybdopterin converting factor subunit 1 [Gammaproteobacteria bacterium]|nr:molybdopterin converting factor subunit 1 [Gammaproteobacteria bacterium]NIR84149.1 molybdopterin converting factor subunit 1 [Gammaproteobacteria bacterium]NIR89461.1 molybdopterin converting factor subunit 1 [Gammaproteobacteria bacterium]NIU05304.1 molybdopterin converting factor subunit 1 [Gammaproteobacteria bacterium]NIV52244.1 molybdopterin converting factor subunit 1 [Gammaproteobacteria bacterium]
MTITVRYFARLRERMGRESEEVALADRQGTVADVWAQVSGGEPFPQNVLAAVNHEYVDIRHPVRDGDEVAFFPPVTGGKGQVLQ